MNNQQLPDIKSRESLQLAIELLKERIDLQEKSIANRVHQLPSELFKSASGAILPAIINQTSIAGIWKILKLVPIVQTLFSIFRKKSQE
ncbi:MAG: hypothetical protein WCP74_03440 [Sphingobacteriia bacterium]|jgi:hypothetical protein